LRVAVIDGGVMPEAFSIGALKYDMRVTKWGIVRKLKDKEPINSFHGTIVAGIIKKYAPQAELCSIQIFGCVIIHRLPSSYLTVI
jgi:hypothetical protein